MKKMKKSLLSLVTAFIMSASMLPSMITANAEYIEETVLYSNDLESGKTLDKTTTVADPTDATNNVAKYNAGWAQPNIKLSEKVSSGIIEVKFDYMANATNSSFHVDLAANRETKNFLTFFRRSGKTIEGAADGNYGTVEIGKWYTIDTVVDLDTKHYTSVVKDKATGTVIANVDTTLTPSSREFKDWPETVTEFTDFFFQGGSAEDYLDNILVRTLVERPVEKVLYSNDLESGKTLDRTTTVADPTDSTNNVAKYNAGWAQPNIKLSEKVSSGIIEVKFDYMANATNSSFHVDLAANRETKNFLTFFRRSGTLIEGPGSGNYGNVELGKWYTIDSVVNLNTKHYMSVVKDKATGKVLESVDTTLAPSSREFKDWPETVTEFTDFFFQGGSAEDYLDNILVKTLLEEPEMPKVSERVLYSNDLESGKTLDKTTTVADPTDATNNVAKYNAGWAQPNVKLSEKVSSGIIEVKFDYMANGTGSSFHVDLAADRVTKNFLTFFRRTGTLIEGPGEGNYGNVETGKWYTIDSVVNLNTKHYMSVVKDKATGKVLKSVDVTLAPSSREFKDWPETVNEFTDFFFQGGSAEDYLDNILVKTLMEEPEMEQEEEEVEKVLYSNDVESGKLHDGGTTTVVDPVDSPNNCAKYNGNWYGAGLGLSEPVSSGIVQVKFDYMTNATGSSFHFDLAGSERSGKNLLTLIRRNGTTMEGAAGRYGTFETGKWYTVNTVINFDTKHYVTYIIDKATGKVLNSVDTTLSSSTAEYSGWPAEINEFTMLFFAGGSTEDYLDNVFVTTLLEEPAPLPMEKTLYSNDVESGKLHNGGTTTVTDPADSTNNVAKFNGSWYGAGLDLSEKVNSGIVEVKFDYMANSTGSSFYFTLAGSERSGKNLLTFIRRSGDKLEGAAGVYAALETGKWYTIDTVVNLDTKHYMSVVKDKATGKVLKSIDTTLEATTAEYSGWPAEINEFTMLFFSGGSTEDYLDNVLVKTLLEEPEMEQEEVDPKLLYSNDFQIGSAPTNGTINTDSGNKYLTLNGGWKNIQYKFNKVTTDKIKVTFDFMNTASNSSFYAALLDSSVSNSDGVEFLNLIRDEKKMECYSSTQNRNILGDHVDNQWLTYEAVIDMNTRKGISTVYNKATGDAIATVEVTLSPSEANLADWPKTATAFDTFLIVSGRENGTHIDNLLIEKVVEAPSVSADKVTIKDAKGEVQNVWTKVSPLSKVFEIGFGTSLNEETVTNESIYVTKKGSTAPLAGNVTYADGKAVLTLAADLEVNTEYVLNITTDITNILGEALADSAAYEFKTDSGIVSAVMGMANVDGNAVTSFASLNAGDLIKVPVTYVNSTGKAKDLYFVVAYYKNSFKELADVEFITTPFNGTITNGEYEFEHTFKTVEGADSIRFMMWDGFDSLVPLSSSVSVK